MNYCFEVHVSVLKTLHCFGMHSHGLWSAQKGVRLYLESISLTTLVRSMFWIPLVNGAMFEKCTVSEMYTFSSYFVYNVYTWYTMYPLYTKDALYT